MSVPQETIREAFTRSPPRTVPSNDGNSPPQRAGSAFRGPRDTLLARAVWVIAHIINDLTSCDPGTENHTGPPANSEYRQVG